MDFKEVKNRSFSMEMILIGYVSGKIIFIFRDVILCYFGEVLNENQIKNQIKTWLKSFYKTKKIKSGSLRASISSSKTRSFVLSNLDLSLEDSELPFVFAHLKQHLGESFKDTAVDFKRISDHEVWVETCSNSELKAAMIWHTDRVPLVSLEPSLESLRRILRVHSLFDFQSLSHSQHIGFFWIDATPTGKKYRLTFCEGIEVIWDKVLQTLELSFPAQNSGNLFGEEKRSDAEIISDICDFLEFSLREYSEKILGSLGGSPRQIPIIYLWITSDYSSALTACIKGFFSETVSQKSEVISILPEDFGLEYPDEFVAYGLAIR